MGKRIAAIALAALALAACGGSGFSIGSERATSTTAVSTAQSTLIPTTVVPTTTSKASSPSKTASPRAYALIVNVHDPELRNALTLSAPCGTHDRSGCGMIAGGAVLTVGSITQAMLREITAAATAGGPDYIGDLVDESAKTFLRDTRAHLQALSAAASDLVACASPQSCAADVRYAATSVQVKSDLDRWQTYL